MRTTNTSNETTRKREVEEITYTSYRTPSALETDKVRESLFTPALFTEIQTKAILAMPFKTPQDKIPLIIISPGSEGYKHTSSFTLNSLDRWFNDQGIAYCLLEHQQDSLSKNQYQISLESQLIDAFEVAKIFSGFKSFDTNKIGISGLSRGQWWLI